MGGLSYFFGRSGFGIGKERLFWRFFGKMKGRALPYNTRDVKGEGEGISDMDIVASV